MNIWTSHWHISFFNDRQNIDIQASQSFSLWIWRWIIIAQKKCSLIQLKFQTRTKFTEKNITRPDRKIIGKTLSTASTSLLKRFNTRPRGVVSNSVIGHRNTCFNNISCISFAEQMKAIDSVMFDVTDNTAEWTHRRIEEREGETHAWIWFTLILCHLIWSDGGTESDCLF